MTVDPWFVAMILVCVFGAALVNGILGFGFALLAVVVVSLVADPRLAVVSMSLVTPVLTAAQIRHHWGERAITWRLRWVLIGSVIGSIIGSQVLLIAPSWVLLVGLGLFALWYAISSMRRERPQLRVGTERVLAPVVGLLAGTLNGSLGASGPVLGSYLHAIGLRVAAFAFAISLVFAFMGVVRVVSLAVLGAYDAINVLLGVSMLLPAVVGQRVGFVVQRRLEAARVNRLFLVLLVFSGVTLLLKGVLAVAVG
jgi:uncharacterized membrane protein YfcA